jgi:hypothetical protein
MSDSTKFIEIDTIKNNGMYKNISNTCFFISISDILKIINNSSFHEGHNIEPDKLRKMCRFRGNNEHYCRNNDIFDIEINDDDNFKNMLKNLNICIIIFPCCIKKSRRMNIINTTIYYKICAYDNYKYVIPIVNYNNIHFEPIVNTEILFEDKIIFYKKSQVDHLLLNFYEQSNIKKMIKRDIKLLKIKKILNKYNYKKIIEKLIKFYIKNGGRI